MKQPTDLIVYDFDDTICKTPGPESYRTLSRTVPIEDLPVINDMANDYMKWWEHAISLNTNVFNIGVIRQIRDLNLNRRNKETAHVLITRRSPNLLPHIRGIMDSCGMRMDKCFTNEWSTQKVDVLNEYLSQNKSIMNILICEDSYKNIIDYKNGLDAKYNTYYLFVSVPMIYMLDRDLKNMGEHDRISLIFKEA